MKKYLSALAQKWIVFSSSLSPLLFWVTVLFFAGIITVNFTLSKEQNFVFLTHSFLQGKLFFIDQLPSIHDTAPFGGKLYWPMGPFPAVLLMPFVWLSSFFALFFNQGYLQVFLTTGIFYFFFRLARHFYFSISDAWYVGIAFCFASAFFGIALFSTYTSFGHIVAIFFLCAALVEYLVKKRCLLAGVCMGLVLATRTTAGIGILFFLLDILSSHNSWKNKIRSCVALCLPVFLCAVLLLFYNAARFGNPFEHGYNIQTSFIDALTAARAYGLFGIIHIPANLYYLFLAGPLPIFRDSVSHVLTFPFLRYDSWGMGIFFTSPYLLYLFFFSYKDTFSRNLLVAIFAIALPILLYYGIGFRQFGYRYALDFLPFVYVLFLYEYSKTRHTFSRGLKITILASACINAYFLFS